MRSIRAAFRLPSRRSIRTREDLPSYVLRMSGCVVATALLISAILSWPSGTETVIYTCLAVGTVTLVLAVPITWEFGHMYLDLWTSTRELRDLASLDHQTGLLNNRAFIASVEERLGAGRRMALLIGDLDDFKSVNDRHGHLVGDEVIARVGATLRGLFADSALVGRLGGEEYAVSIDCVFSDPAAARAHVAALAEEMRRRIATLFVAGPRGDVAPTISVGFALSRPGSDFSDLFARADRALYVAKANGRNRVVGEDDVDEYAAHPVIPAGAGDLSARIERGASTTGRPSSVAWA